MVCDMMCGESCVIGDMVSGMCVKGEFWWVWLCVSGVRVVLCGECCGMVVRVCGECCGIGEKVSAIVVFQCACGISAQS